MTELEPAAGAAALQAVLAAFPARPFPKGLQVSAGGRWFDEQGALHAYDDPESAAVARFFGGKAWADVRGDDLLAWGRAAVSYLFLTAEALAYYLPAYLKAFVTVPLHPLAFTAVEAGVRALVPPDAVEAPQPQQPPDARSGKQRQAMALDRQAWFDRFHRSLTAPQAKAVAQVLEALVPVFDDPHAENTARVALDRFWRERAAG